MSETSRREEPREGLHEHLTEGFRPIMACVGTEGEYGDEIENLRLMEKASHDVNYSGLTEDLKSQDFRLGGFETYVISKIDDKPKFTKKLFDCTTLMVVGRDKESGKEISFLTHQDPKKILFFKEQIFTKDLKEQLQKMKEKCEEGSIDIAIAGGNLNEEKAGQYERTIELLDSIVKEVCGFDPLVVSGPKEAYGSDSVYFDTENRRAYIVRPERGDYKHNFHTDVFKAPKVREKREELEGVTRQRRKKEEREQIERNK